MKVRRLLIAALIALTGCIPPVINMVDPITVYGMTYRVREVTVPSVAGTWGAAHNGEVIVNGFKEVEINGRWYRCTATCSETVRTVLAEKAPIRPIVPPASPPPISKPVLDVQGGGGGY